MTEHDGKHVGPTAENHERFAPTEASPRASTDAGAGAVRHVNLMQGFTELNALLGHGTTYEGKLFFEGRCRIEGQLKGSIRGDGILVVGHGAVIEGDIEVESCLVVGGHVRGNIRARKAIEMHLPAEVQGDIHAPNVFIDRGVQFEGNCRIAPLDSLAAGGTTPPTSPELQASSSPVEDSAEATADSADGG